MRMRVNLPLTREGARPRAPRIGSQSSTYPKHSIEPLARLRIQRIARTRSLPTTENEAACLA